MTDTIETITADGTWVQISIQSGKISTRAQVEDALSAAYLEAFRRIDKDFDLRYVGTNTTTKG